MHTDLRESVLVCGPLFFPQTLFESWAPNFGMAWLWCNGTQEVVP